MLFRSRGEEVERDRRRGVREVKRGREGEEERGSRKGMGGRGEAREKGKEKRERDRICSLTEA